jgi:peptide/nickel transport system substrate-binding protein
MKLRQSISLLIATVVFGTAIAPRAVSAQATQPATPACTAYQEAPILADQVKAGTLPAVKDRLPEHPVVVTPAEKVGIYGGSMKDLYDGSRLAEFRAYGYEGLVRWSVDGSKVIPNIAESWEILNGGKDYVFHLRKGMKWSDGQPFTADDILFWWETVESDTKINAQAEDQFYSNGELATVTKVDDLSVKFSWSTPQGLFLQTLSESYGVRVTQFAKHYLQQFTMKYNPDGVAKMMKDANETDYGKWWKSRVGSYGSQAEYNDPARPFLQAWIPTTKYVGVERFTFKRNPYYFKVDTACNQLPYIDERVFTLATDPQVRLLKTLSGEAFLSARDISQPPNKSVFFDNQEKGNYRFVDVTNSDHNTMNIHLLFNTPDKVQADIFANKDFRIGLSQAIDRKNIIDTVYVGQGVAAQTSPRPESPFYNQRLSTQYTQYDVAAANAALDKVLPKKDADGFRLRPDGKRFHMNFVVNQGFRPDWVDVMTIVQKNWQAVGLEVKVDNVGDDIFGARRDDPATDGYVWAGENGLGLQPLLALDDFTPDYAPAWRAWAALQLNPKAQTGVAPITPPEILQKQYMLIPKIRQAVTAEDQLTLGKQFFETMADGFFMIGVSLPAGDYRVVNNTLRNVPKTLISGWLYPGPSPMNFETFYIDPSFAKK